MTIDKSVDLGAALTELRRQDLEKLVETIESDRLRGGNDLPHATLLTAVRPALRGEKDMPRVLSPQRMFCSVFEDLLPEPGQPETSDQISRASIEPMWRYLSQQYEDQKLASRTDEIAELIMAENLVEAWQKTCVFQEEAGHKLKQEIEKASRDDATYSNLCDDLGGENVLNDLREMAMCLEIASTIHGLQDRFERPIGGFDGSGLMVIGEEYKKVAADRSGHSRYLLYVLMGRMARPWEIMMLISSLVDADGNYLITQLDRSLMGELILTELDLVSGYFENINPVSLNKDDFLKHLNYFVQLTGGLRHASILDRSNNWSYRLRLTSERVARELESLTEKMPAKIMAALPMKDPGGYGLRVPRVPEVSTPPKAPVADVSIRMMRLFSELRLYADQTGFSTAYHQAMNQIDNEFERYKSSILEHLPLSEGDERENSIAFANLVADIASEMNRLDEADQIRQRVEAITA